MTEPRTLAPPERRVAEVIGVRRLGAYTLISATDSDGPADPCPGQFYMLATAAGWGGGCGERPYLPRAFSFARSRAGAGGGTELDFLLEDVGPGTHRLGLLREGEALELVGPLGVGFRGAAEDTRPLLVGGGVGTAPLLCLSDDLDAAGTAAPVLLGFRSAAHAHAAELFRGEVTVVTDDGSAGRHGLVTEPLDELLEGGPPATVYACGPPAMLEAVRALCASRGVDAQLALESGMACGFGACFGCVVPTRHGLSRVCVDGPVFDAATLETAAAPGGGHQG